MGAAGGAVAAVSDRDRHAASGGNAAANSRSGVARVLSVYELYLEGQSLGLTTSAVGSSFGVGEAGKETDVFVTNRHVVADFQREWSTYELVRSMGGETALVGVNTISFNLKGVDSSESNHSGSVASEHVMRVLDSIGVKYETYPQFPLALVIGVGAVAIAAIVVVAVALTRKKRVTRQREVVVPAQELRIQGQTGAFAGRRFSINGQMRIGRDPAANDLVYPNGVPGISGRHCAVTLSAGQVTLTDLGSSYGTFLAGGRKLTPNQPVPLRVGDQFYLGSEKESFVITGKGGSLL